MPRQISVRVDGIKYVCNMKWRVLVTDNVEAILVDDLIKFGIKVDYEPNISYGDVCKKIAGYHGVVINSKVKANAAFLEQASQLKFIARLGSGLDIIDLAKAKEKGIQIFSSPQGNCDAVAEHALGMLLSFLHKLHTANTEVKRFEWNREAHRGSELSFRKVGIVGFGNTGKAFSKKLSGLVPKVFVFDPYVHIESSQYLHVCYSFEELLSQVDVVSFHVQLTQETEHIADEKFFETLNPGSILINTSRGAVVKTLALIEALKQKKLAGALLDVFENEKTATYSDEEADMYRQLFAFDNVLVSPHVAGWTIESKRKIAEILLQQIKSFAASLENSSI